MSLDSHDPYFQADIESEGDDDDRNRPMRRGTGIGGGRLGTRGSTGVGGSSGSFEDTNVEYEQIMDNGLRGPLRKGKWTMEEEQYANKIINYFNKGLLGIPNGTTLRSYLSEKLNCDPMRITKKFAGASCIGKQVYQSCEESTASTSTLTRIEEELKGLQLIFLKRLWNKSGGSSTASFGSLDMDDFETEGSGGVALDGKNGSRASGSSGALNGKAKSSRTALEKSVPFRTTSAPDLTMLNLLQNKSTSSYTSLIKRQRSISLMDLEHYAVDDDAAGDLLLQFVEKIKESTIKKLKYDDHLIKEEELSQEKLGFSATPVTFDR